MTKTTIICDVDGTLTDGTVYVDTDGRELIRFHKRDGWKIRQAREAGIDVVLVTDDPNIYPVQARAAKMGVGYNGPSVSKLDAVRYYKHAGHRVVYIGDSPADVEAMREADEAWAPMDAMLDLFLMEPSPEVPDGRHWPADDLGNGKPVWRTYRRGGEGVLDEVLGRLLDADGE